MRKLILFPLFLFLTLSLASADEPSIVRDEFTIIDSLKKLPLKEGVTWDYIHHRGLNTISLGIIGYGPVGLDLSFIGIDGVGATLDYNLAYLPVKNVPIISYVQYLNIGYTVGCRTLAFNPVTDNPKQDNALVQGPTVFMKFKF